VINTRTAITRGNLIKLGSWVGITVVLGLVPVVIGFPYLQFLIVLGLLYAILASNWDLTLGYAGIFNFAHIAIFALGAYTTGILAVQFGISPWIGLIVSMPVAVVAAAIAYVPTIRLRGIYVALVTFVFAQLILRLILGLSKYTGGGDGLVGIPNLSVGDYVFAQDNKMAYYYLVLALFLASTFFLRRVVGSRVGLGIVALRDFENLAASRGISTFRQRLLAFMLSAIFTGLAGGVFGLYIGVVSPELFSFSYVSLLLSMILLGGIGTVYGPIVGAVIMTFLSEPMAQLGYWRFVIIGVVIVLVLRFLPGGILSIFTASVSRPWGRGGLAGSAPLSALRRSLSRRSPEPDLERPGVVGGTSKHE
jgi:branched-chain amino acid transport system permease protein